NWKRSSPGWKPARCRSRSRSPPIDAAPSCSSSVRPPCRMHSSRSRFWKATSSKTSRVTTSTDSPRTMVGTVPDFQAWSHAHLQRIEAVLQQVLPAPEIAPQRLHQAMRYAVLGGGKRVRPLLAFAAGGGGCGVGGGGAVGG